MIEARARCPGMLGGLVKISNELIGQFYMNEGMRIRALQNIAMAEKLVIEAQDLLSSMEVASAEVLEIERIQGKLDVAISALR